MFPDFETQKNPAEKEDPMTAGELMARKFESVHADARIEEVARKLDACGTSHLPVCRDGLLVGVVSHEDVAASTRRMSRRVRVGDVIAPDIIFCFEGTDVTEAAKLMRENRVSLLPVLSRAKRLVGVLSLSDIPGERVPQRTA